MLLSPAIALIIGVIVISVTAPSEIALPISFMEASISIKSDMPPIASSPDNFSYSLLPIQNPTIATAKEIPIAELSGIVALPIPNAICVDNNLDNAPATISFPPCIHNIAPIDTVIVLMSRFSKNERKPLNTSL